jgi:hypothetical protein
LGVNDKAEPIKLLLNAVGAENGNPTWQFDSLNPGALMQIDQMATTP